MLHAIILTLLAATVTPPAAKPVLLELYTSEGCSSCPPADRLLAELVREPPQGVVVVPLAFHVDYWNRLGWTDPWSAPEWSRRQREQADRVERGRVYTPQVIVDGREAGVGSDAAFVREALERAAGSPSVPIALRLSPVEGQWLVEATTGQAEGTVGPWALHFAVTLSAVVTDVPRGENSGRRLAHVAVVRELVHAGKVGAGQTKSQGLGPITGVAHVVAWLTDTQSGAVAGAARVAVESRDEGARQPR